MWSRDGREIFFVDAQLASIRVAAIETGDAFRFAAPVKLFDLQFRRAEVVPFDVSLDGQRILVNTYGEEAFSTPLAPVQNWTAELKE